MYEDDLHNLRQGYPGGQRSLRVESHAMPPENMREESKGGIYALAGKATRWIHAFMTSLKKKIYRAQEERCFYCHEWYAMSQLTYDHFVPLSKGGIKSKTYNVVLACQPCNLIKGNKPWWKSTPTVRPNKEQFGFPVEERDYMPKGEVVMVNEHSITTIPMDKLTIKKVTVESDYFRVSAEFQGDAAMRQLSIEALGGAKKLEYGTSQDIGKHLQHLVDEVNNAKLGSV